MRVLMLTPYLPYPLLSGGQIRTYNLLKQLAKQHEVTLFALIKNDSEKAYVQDLAPFCKKIAVFKRPQKPFTLKNIFRTAVSRYPFLVIRNHSRSVMDAVVDEINSQPYDLIHAETFYMMPHLPQTNIPVILVEQTIEYLGYESYAKKANPLIRPLLAIDIAKIKYWETHYWQHCHTLIVMSQEDKALIGHSLTDQNKIEVVANGVDLPWFDQVTKRLPNKPTLLFVGTFKWLPNREAVNFLVNQIWPGVKAQFPDLKLKIVGNSPTRDILNYARQDKDIEVIGNLPDIRDAFSRAHVLVAPVFSGKGTRYKVLEAMAAHTPVVATPLAVEGLNIQSGKHALVGQNAAELISAIVKLIQDEKLQKKLAQNGYEFVKTHYDWHLIADKLDKIYQRIGLETAKL